MGGMRVKLENGEATVQSDKEHILNYITAYQQKRSHGKSDEPPAALQNTNNSLNALFARAAWPQAVKRDLVLDFDTAAPGSLCLPSLLKKDDELQSLKLSLEHSEKTTDSVVCTLAGALPPNLYELSLSFEGCQHVTSESLRGLARHLPQNLLLLKLDFLGCKKIDDAGVDALAGGLPQHLRELTVHFDNCPNISIVGIRALARGTPASVTCFRGTFQGTKFNSSFDTVSSLRRTLQVDRKTTVRA